jgi:ABC-type multidrug transport system ATPase subunit
LPADAPELARRLADTGLGEAAANRPVDAYSTGMRQRLRVAFALLFDPPILLLDEPMAGLDADGREMVLAVVVRARERGAVVLASNDERDFVRPDRRLDLSAEGGPR